MAEERVRKILVIWDRCPICGREWAFESFCNDPGEHIWCPRCAELEIDLLRKEAKALHRSIAAYKGLLTRKANDQNR